jgi:hypothetical protein
MKEFIKEWVSEGLDYFEILDKLKARIPLGEDVNDYSDTVIYELDMKRVKQVGSTAEQIREYYSELSVFDWFYDYSDDHSVWTRGNEGKKVLYDKSYDSVDFYTMYREFVKWTQGRREKPIISEFMPNNA